MDSKYSINLRRLLLLVRSTLFINLKLILILAAVFSAIIILIALKDTLTGDLSGLYLRMYFLVLYVSGFVVTWSISRDLHDKNKGISWLLLPASTMEKYLTLLLIPTLLLAVGVIIYMSAISLLIEAGLNVFTNAHHNIFNPFSKEILAGTIVYFVIQAPYLLGAIYFRKHAISYTFLSLFVYWVILTIFIGFTGGFFLGEYLKPLHSTFNQTGNFDGLYFMVISDRMREFWGTWKPFVTAFFFYIVPLLCWITAFFSLKEMEQ